MASDAAKCRDPVKRRHLRKIAQKARCAKLWVNGRASKDRDEWTEEVTLLRRRADRIRRHRSSGDRRVAVQGRRVTITVDKVLRARGKMLRNKEPDAKLEKGLRGFRAIERVLQMVCDCVGGYAPR